MSWTHNKLSLRGTKMPRTKSANPNHLVKGWISPELKGKLYLHLTSELEGRIPLGKISEFIAERTREFFGWETLSLEAYGFPAGYFVKGPPAMIQALRTRLARPEEQVVLSGCAVRAAIQQSDR